MKVDKKILASIGQGLLRQRRQCRESESFSLEGINYIDAEHIDGAIRAVVAAQGPALSKVKVFPVYSVEQMGHLTKKTRQHKKEEKEEKEEIADKPGYFDMFLGACRHTPALFESPEKARVDMVKGSQWVIPILLGEAHYTILTVHFYSQDKFFVRYYDSLGAKLPEDIQQGLQQHLAGSEGGCPPSPFTKGKWQDSSHADQKEAVYHHCGVFAFYKAIAFIHRAANLPLPKEFSRWLSEEEAYEDTMQRYRRLMEEYLKRTGHNIQPLPEEEAKAPSKTAPARKPTHTAGFAAPSLSDPNSSTKAIIVLILLLAAAGAITYLVMGGYITISPLILFLMLQTAFVIGTKLIEKITDIPPSQVWDPHTLSPAMLAHAHTPDLKSGASYCPAYEEQKAQLNTQGRGITVCPKENFSPSRPSL